MSSLQQHAGNRLLGRLASSASQPGKRLGEDLQTSFEASFGTSLDSVRLHTDGAADAVARLADASAVTRGDDIYFRRGVFAPSTPSGRELLAHELTHVVQQRRRGVGLQAAPVLFSSPQDSAEREAAAVAPRAAAGEPVTVSAAPGALLARQSPHPPPDIDVRILAHASPLWTRPGESTPEERNQTLSEERQAAVEAAFRKIFAQEIAGMGSAALQIGRRSVDLTVSDPSHQPRSLESEALGSSQTLAEAGGDSTADHPLLRRVDVRVILNQLVEGEAPFTRPGTEEVFEEAHCEGGDVPTQRWAIRVKLSGGAGHAGAGGAFLQGEIRNLDSGAKVMGIFVGVGGGAGLQTPGANPWGDWVSFTTNRRATFGDFDNALTRLTSIGAGVAIIGYAAADLTFESLGTGQIDVSGWNMGAFGADASSSVGVWKHTSTVPSYVCFPSRVYDVPTAATDAAPYSFEVPYSYDHSAYFDTGSATLSAEELERLTEFVRMAIDEYSLLEQNRTNP